MALIDLIDCCCYSCSISYCLTTVEIKGKDGPLSWIELPKSEWKLTGKYLYTKKKVAI